MATNPDPADERASAEAIAWLIALQEDPDDAALRARFDAWHEGSPDNASAWAETTGTDRMIRRVPPTHAERWLPRRAGSARNARSPQRLRPRVLAAAAAVFIVGAALLVGPEIMLRVRADHVTSTAELRAIRLEDSSVVQLGGASAISTAFTPDERIVRLLKGEAYFEVERDAARPFSVEVNGFAVTALGTAFDVRSLEGHAEISVRHGVVRVEGASVSETLLAGEWARVSAEGGLARGTMPPGQVAAWLQGQLIAKDRPLSEVVDELRRYFGGVIVIADGALEARTLTGIYDLADPEAALRAVASAHGAKVRRLSPWLLVLSRS